MRKLFLFLAAIAAMLLLVAPATGQEIAPAETDFIVRQSADAGDPHSFHIIVVQERVQRPEHRSVYVVEPMWLLNVEHPMGAEGTIVGTLYTFAPGESREYVTEFADRLIETGNQSGYVGTTEGDNWSPTDFAIRRDFWVLDPRINTETPVQVPGSEWTWENIEMSTTEVLCPATTAVACLYQAWDGNNGSVAHHIVLQPGSEFVPWERLQGTIYMVSGVTEENLPTLFLRFNQMSQEVRIRDTSSTSTPMVINQLWVGENPASGWTPLEDFLEGLDS